MFYGEALGISSNKFSNVTALKTLFPMFYSETETRRDSISKIKFPRKDYKTLEEIAQSLDRCFNKSVCTQPLIAVSAFYQLLDLICQHLTVEQNNDLRKPVRHKVHHEEIANVITYIHQNFGKKITLDNMVQHASSSRSRLGESFKRVTGMSPMHYLNIYRLEKASELLKMGSHPIRTIANKVGLFDNAHLTRLFKSVFGVSPMQFRMSHKQSLGAS